MLQPGTRKAVEEGLGYCARDHTLSLWCDRGLEGEEAVQSAEGDFFALSLSEPKSCFYHGSGTNQVIIEIGWDAKRVFPNQYFTRGCNDHATGAIIVTCIYFTPNRVCFGFELHSLVKVPIITREDLIRTRDKFDARTGKKKEEKGEGNER